VELSTLSYAVVDVETTGTWVNGGDRIMEVAVVQVHEGEIRTAVEFLVNPQRAIKPWVTRLTGIRWEMLHEAPTFGDIADRVREALDDHIFVAHNARFDWRFLSQELRRATGRGLCPGEQRLCTVKLARRLLEHLPRRNLDALAWHYDVQIVGRHRAGGDARATARILRHLLADARRRDLDTMEQLQAFMRAPRPSPVRSALPQPVTVEAVA
jgi:DNA polymerase-3 subunit epsilon